MEKQKITYQYADIGHWLARCNHKTYVIELNANEWDSLSPLMKDYIWVHECVHLLTDITDEQACNSISDAIFLSRSRNARDRQQRLDFVTAANDLSFTRIAKPASDKTSLLVVALAIAVILFITKK